MSPPRQPLSRLLWQERFREKMVRQARRLQADIRMLLLAGFGVMLLWMLVSELEAVRIMEEIRQQESVSHSGLCIPAKFLSRNSMVVRLLCSPQAGIASISQPTQKKSADQGEIS